MFRVAGGRSGRQPDQRHQRLGHYPNASVAVLIEAGADVQARFTGRRSEPPPRWAASCDRGDVLDALLNASPEIESGRGVVGEGPRWPMPSRSGQGDAARRLVECGAQPDRWT